MIQITNINNVSFTGKIIDSHVHAGDWNGITHEIGALDVFIKQPLANNDTIEKVVISSLDCISHKVDEIEGNRQMAEIAKANKKIIPLAVGLPQNGSVENIEKVFNEYPDIFKGLKLHPDAECLSASSEKYDKYLAFAQQKKLPCLFHCGINYKPNSPEFVDEPLRYSAPEHIYEAAKKIPDTPVIFAHLGSGGEKVHNLATETLIESIEKNDAKLYADISWVDCDNSEKPNIVNLIKELQSTTKGDKTDRILFGTDAPLAEFSAGKNGLSAKEYYEKTVVDVKNAIRNNFDNAEELIDKIFYKNANDLFLKQDSKKALSSMSKKIKAGLIITAAGAVVAAGITFLIKYLNKNRTKAV